MRNAPYSTGTECRLVDTYPGGDRRLVAGELRAMHLHSGLPFLREGGRYFGIDTSDWAAGTAP